MKISAKIILLALLLLAILAVDGVVSLRLLNRMGGELKGVVHKDVVMMQAATAITQYQLQKAVIFERVRRIAEELAYQETTPARREHLLFYTKLARSNFDELAKQGALNIVNTRLLLDETVKSARDAESREKLNRLVAVLKEIEKAHIHYDALAGDLFSNLVSGKYELSQDDLSQVHRDERKLTTELQNFVEAVQKFTQDSLAKANNYERTAENILLVLLPVSLFFALILAISIIRAIVLPLKGLVSAAERVGSGDLEVRLQEKNKDEFGELSRAFNRMSRQIAESQKKLEDQSGVLRRNLEITDLQKKDLEKVNRELDRFVHTVSHDIRSPLMGIAWYADFLKKQHYEKLDQKGKDSVDGVIRGVDRSNALIRDLLALTRLSRVRNPYQHVPIGVVVDEVVGNLEYKIKQNRVDLRVQPNMPVIVCDGIKIKEVFLNLLTNAIKFSSGNGDVQPVVSIGYRDSAQAHEFFVKDNGIGIAPKDHEEIFAIFKRLDNSDKYEGTGAGLSIVKSIVEDHGGKVWVVSDLGLGTEMHFSIPKDLKVHVPVIAGIERQGEAANTPENS